MTDILITSNGVGAMYARTPSDHHHGAVVLTANEQLGFEFDTRNHGKLWRSHTIGSVVSYMLESGRDPLAGIDRARANGHKMHWINANGATITAWKREPAKHVIVTIGMLVKFEGLYFTIAKAPNDNLALVPADVTIV